jgi:hypothetical protein
MFNQEAFSILLDRVPDLKSPWGILVTMVYAALLAFGAFLFFRAVDPLGPYAPLISQLVMALLTVLICYVHLKLVNWYRQRYDLLAYRPYFYQLMLPYLVAWYACVFHPLFINGPALLPGWLAILFGVILLLSVPILSIHIERSGFHMETYGLDLYTLFPGEAPVVRGEIYAYIRHPLYLALTCATFGLALIANNWIALTAALLQLIPALFAGWMEDRELVQRTGREHQEYISHTGALLPRGDVLGFFRLLLIGLFSP